MHQVFSSIRARLPRIAAALLLFAGSAFAAEVTYNPTTGIVSIPSVQVGGTTYVNVTLGAVPGADYVFALQGATPGTVTGVPLATYDLGSGVLTMPAVRLGQSVFRVQLKNIGNFTFNLASVANVQPFTFYSKSQPGVAQTATLVNGVLNMDGATLTEFAFGESAVDISETLQSWASPWNTMRDQAVVQAMLFCTSDGKLSHVVVKDSLSDGARSPSTAQALVDAIQAAPAGAGVSIYSTCSGQPTDGWNNNLPAATFSRATNPFVQQSSAAVLGQLSGAVILRQQGAPANQHNFIGITWKGTTAFEVWQ